MKIEFKSLSLSLALALAFGAASAQEERRLPAQPGQKLSLELKTGGSVSVVGWSRNEVWVSYDVNRCSPGSCRVEVLERDDGVEIVSGYLQRSRHQSSSIDIEVKVPDVFDIELDSMGGGLEIRDLEGDFRGKTMGGNLMLSNVRGVARLQTMGGRIDLLDSDLDGRLSTMGGKVLFRDVVGDVKGSSMGGVVRYQNVRRRDGEIASPSGRSSPDHTEGTVQMSTMGGAIDIDDAPEGADLHTMGGDISVDRAAGFVKAQTMGGDITLGEVDGWVKATTMGGSVEAVVLGASSPGRDVELVSMSGDVELTLPADASVTFEVKLSYTRNRTKRYEIISDFPLRQERSDSWDYSHGTPRKHIMATGVSGGGANKVRLETVNGNIRIKRER